jgi:carboxypeptidase family protein/TonB-dependent receptor-like protein
MSSLRKAVQLLIGTMGLLLLCLPLFSQGSSGRILGTVTDQSGGVVAGATVTVIDTERGVTRSLTSDDAGEFNAPNLTPGTYTVRAEAKGFKKLERQNVALEVGKEIRVDLTLQPGAAEQTITVTEAIPLVETTNATLGGTLNNADIQDMPLNGRNYQNLLSLRPGVFTQPGGSPWTQSTNNVRPDETVWMLDGVLNVNFYDARPIASMPSPYTDGATILPVDSIQEFNLEENPKAEYGWKPGAIVNVGVRSGTNTFHGSAYGFYRSQAWEARSLFNPVDAVGNSCHTAAPTFCSKSPVQLKQFGGALGGPIKKDKLFFFANYEGLRSFIGQALGTTGTPETVGQSTPDPAHSMVDAINAQVLAGGAASVSPVSLKLAGCTLGPPVTCTGGLFPSNTGSSIGYSAPWPNSNISDNGVGKIEYHINSKHMLNGTALISDYTGDGIDHPILNNIMRDTFLAHTRTVDFNEVWTPSSRLVNDFRFAYNRVYAPFFNDDSGLLSDGSGGLCTATGCGGKGFPINTGITAGGLPNIYIGTLTALGTWHNRPAVWDNTYYDFQDSVSYLVGKHTFKFGVEYAHILVDATIHDNVRGRLNFGDTGCPGATCVPALQHFFAGTPKTKDGGRIFVGNATTSPSWNSTGAFFQDDWRVAPKLTINLGLRYSYTSPMKEANNLWGNFDPNSPSGMVQQGDPGVGPTLWKPDHKDFSPRAGFAYDISGKGTTVVRGGFSLIYSTIVAAQFLSEINLQNSTATNIAAVPTGACKTSVAPGVPCPATYGGTIVSAAVKLPGSSLNYDPCVGQVGTCTPSALNGGTVFPTGAVVSCTAAAPCNILAVDPNLLTPYVLNWSLGVQHAFNSNLSLEVGYVGTHGSRLTGFRDLNQPTTQADRISGTQKYAAQFPWLNFINQMSNDGRSNYSSLQATLTERTSHGLSFTAGYTYGHGLDNGSLNRAGYLPQDSTNPGAEYASSDFDVRHRFTFTTTYAIPGVKGFGQLLEGWKLNSIVTIQSPQAWLVNETSGTFNFSNAAGDNTDRWDFSGNPGDFRSGANSIPYCTGPVAGGCTITSGVTNNVATSFNLTDSTAMWNKCAAAAGSAAAANLATAGCFVVGNSVMTPPATGVFGNMGRNIFRDAGFKDVDFSVFKTFTFKERYSAEFRVEFFNVFNHPLIANPFGSVNGWGIGNDPSASSTFGCGCASNDVGAGNPQVGSGTPRAMQLGLKLQF